MSKLKTMKCGAAAASAVFLLSACGNDPEPAPQAAVPPAAQKSSYTRPNTFETTHVSAYIIDTEDNRIPVKDAFTNQSTCGEIDPRTGEMVNDHTLHITLKGLERDANTGKEKRKAIYMTMSGDQTYNYLSDSLFALDFNGQQKGLEIVNTHTDLHKALSTFRWHMNESCPDHVRIHKTNFKLENSSIRLGEELRPEQCETPQDHAKNKFELTLSGTITYPYIDKERTYQTTETISVSDLEDIALLDKPNAHHLYVENILKNNAIQQAEHSAVESMRHQISGFMADVKTFCSFRYKQEPVELPQEEPIAAPQLQKLEI